MAGMNPLLPAITLRLEPPARQALSEPRSRTGRAGVLRVPAVLLACCIGAGAAHASDETPPALPRPIEPRPAMQTSACADVPAVRVLSPILPARRGPGEGARRTPPYGAGYEARGAHRLPSGLPSGIDRASTERPTEERLPTARPACVLTPANDHPLPR